MPEPWDGLLEEQDRQVAALSGYGRRAGYGARPALVVVDVTVNFCGDRPEPIVESVRRWRNSCGLAAWEAVEPIRELLAAARGAGLPVIYSAGLDTPPQPVYSGRWAGKNSRRGEDAAAERSGGNEILPPIAPQPGELVIRKTKPSAFFGTPLLSYLVDLQVDTLVCCGATTSGCVRATVVDAFSNNLRVAVVEEATFDRVSVSHRVNLLDIQLKYGDVVPLADAVAYLGTADGSVFRDRLALDAGPALEARP